MHPSTITINSLNPQWNVKELDDLLIDFTIKIYNKYSFESNI